MDYPNGKFIRTSTLTIYIISLSNDTADTETIMIEKSRARCDFPSTDTNGFNSVNASDQSQQHNQSQAATELQPSHQLNSHDSLSHEKHEIIRAPKKISTWTRLDRVSTIQKAGQTDYTSACKRNFSAVGDYLDLTCSKKKGFEEW